MPPPKTIIVDPTRILVSIHDVVQAWISGIEAELATTPLYLRVVLDRELASARSGCGNRHANGTHPLTGIGA